jgi:glyceraldehyde-3-phosphate dehydrogenase (NADP+)
MEFSSGQRYTTVKVICVMESVAKELVTKIVKKMKKLKVGMPEDNCDITPVVSQSSDNFIQGLVEDAQAKGAKFHQEWKRENNLIWPVLMVIRCS